MSRWLILFSIVIFSNQILAQSQRWEINHDHSEILFKASYLNEAEVTGRFSVFSGDVQFADDGQSIQAINLIIRADSIDTGHKIRDGHLRANDFMKAKAFPEITYISRVVQLEKPGHYTTEGDLTLRGVKKNFKLNFEMRGPVKDTWGYLSRFVKFEGMINRKDFNINWNKTIENNLLMLGDEVKFWGALQIQPVSKATPGPKHLIPDTTYIREREKLMRGEMTQAEFDSKYKALQAAPSDSEPISAVAPPEVPASPLTPTVTEVRDAWWWVSFSLLGMFAFLGCVGGMLYLKKIYMESRGDKYTETGWHGNLADGFGIILVLICSLVFWYVGWGR